MSEWVSKSVNEWVLNEWVRVSDWVKSELVSEWVSQLMSDRVSEWMSEWVIEWVSEILS